MTDEAGRTCWHRLGGRAEELFNERIEEFGIAPLAEGRWVCALGSSAPMEWVEGAR